MDRDTRHRLRALVRRFYDARADAFAGTRRHAWPGWRRLLGHLPAGRRPVGRLRVLDAGCGNGRFGAFLRSSWPAGVDYVGLDASAPLLEHARRHLEDAFAANGECANGSWRLSRADLLDDESLDAAIRETSDEPARFDLVALMGVLHHVPGESERARLLRRLGGWLAPRGLLVATVWRADRAPGFARKIVPWTAARAAGVDAPDTERLEAGDHLLGWSGDDGPPRYCHIADDDEVDRLVAASGLVESGRFAADGPTGASNLYVMLRQRAP